MHAMKHTDTKKLAERLLNPSFFWMYSNSGIHNLLFSSVYLVISSGISFILSVYH